MSPSTQLVNSFKLRIKPLLEIIYPEADIQQLSDHLLHLLHPHCSESGEQTLDQWNEQQILLITYSDSIYSHQDEYPLVTLKQFLDRYLQDIITGVHILPVCPYSSDDGFSIIDYLQVNPELGSWDDIQSIAKTFDLMLDLVLNHVSSKSGWVEQFKQGIQPGCDYFIDVDPTTDLSQVVRPRSSPLLVKVDTVNGEKYLWATFSDDQIDVNFANPDVLIEYVKILLFYVVNIGAKYIRLDAVGYLWKRIGTSCIHLPETHALIRLLRELLQLIDPAGVIITETNVPNRENLSYFGKRDEAHIIYNFSLPPLLLNALLQGKSDHLKTWMMSMPPAPMGCTYLNFTASHDGIGLRPAEGLLSDQEYDTLLHCMTQFGGEISYRRQSDGTESPYEINIALFDALKGTVKGEDEWQIARFICSQTIMMSLEGIPAFYIHSLLGTGSDRALMQQTGRKRSINRHRWDMAELEAQLEQVNSPHAIVFQELSRLIQIRRRQEAFHPNATQYTLHPSNQALLVFWRQSMTRDQSIFSIHNLSNHPQTLPLVELNLIATDQWVDLISGQMIPDIQDTLTLQPYQSAWITNKFHRDS